MPNAAAKLRIQKGSSVALIGGASSPAFVLPAGATIASRGPAAVVVLFAPTSAEVFTKLPSAASRLADGGIFWIAYPKAGQLGTDLNRDRLVAMLAGARWQPVSQVAIDDVWSALRIKQDEALAARRAASKSRGAGKSTPRPTAKQESASANKSAKKPARARKNATVERR